MRSPPPIHCAHTACNGSPVTSAIVILSLRSPSTSSQAAAAHEAAADWLAAAREVQGAMLRGAGLPYCRYIVRLEDPAAPASAPVSSALLDDAFHEEAWLGSSSSRGAVAGVEAPRPGRLAAAARVAQSTCGGKSKGKPGGEYTLGGVLSGLEGECGARDHLIPTPPHLLRDDNCNDIHLPKVL